jgi:hypothetical protein
MYRVFQLWQRHAELLAHDLQRLPRLDMDSTSSTSAAMREHRLTEAAIRISNHLGRLVRRQLDQPGIAVRCELDPMQIRIHHLGEDPLTVTHDNQLTHAAPLRSVTRLLREVVQHLGPIGVQAPGSKRMLHPQLRLDPLQRRPDPLQGHAGSRQTGADGTPATT